MKPSRLHRLFPNNHLQVSGYSYITMSTWYIIRLTIWIMWSNKNLSQAFKYIKICIKCKLFHAFLSQNYIRRATLMLRDIFNTLKSKIMIFGHTERAFLTFKGLNIHLSIKTTFPFFSFSQNIQKNMYHICLELVYWSFYVGPSISGVLEWWPSWIPYSHLMPGVWDLYQS